MSNSQTDFNSATSQGLVTIFRKSKIFANEAIKAIALFIKHLFSTFLGK